MIRAVILALILGVAHYYSEEFKIHARDSYQTLVSLSAGVSLTYILLDLMPHFTFLAFKQTKFMFFALLGGFVIFYLIEKYIYKKATRFQLQKDLMIEDSTISFIYHFIIGIIMVDLVVTEGSSQVILFFVPVLLYTAISALPFGASTTESVKVTLALSTLLGVVFAMLVYIDPFTNNALLGLVIGMILYVTTMRTMPRRRLGSPLFFFLGVFAYSILVAMLLF